MRRRFSTMGLLSALVVILLLLNPETIGHALFIDAVGLDLFLLLLELQLLALGTSLLHQTMILARRMPATLAAWLQGPCTPGPATLMHALVASAALPALALAC